MKIHYICRGNVVRSLIADTYTKSLNLPNVEVTSSGTVADRHRKKDFTINNRKRAVELLDRYGLRPYVKSISDQLSQDKVEGQDVIVCVNQRAYDEAVELVAMPNNTIIWSVDDIGEGQRVLTDEDRTAYEEDIFAEIKSSVNELLNIDSYKTLG